MNPQSNNPVSPTFDELIALADEQGALYGQNSDMATLDLAKRHYCAAFDLGPQPGSTVDYVLAYFRFHRLHLLRKQKRGDAEDTPTLTYLEKALAFVPPTHFLRPVLLGSQATSYAQRYQRTKDAADLHSAIRIFETVFAAIPVTNPQRPHLLMQYASALHARHMALRDEADLKRAIELFRIVLKNCPEDLVILTRRSLAFALDSSYKLRYDINEIDNAVKAYSDVVDTLQHQPAEYLYNCAGYSGALYARFCHKGDLGDLHDAVRYLNIVITRCPPTHQHYLSLLASHVNLLIVSSEQKVSTEDIDEAIEYVRNGLRIAPADHPRSELFGTLGYCLVTRFVRFGDVRDLESAVENCYTALSSQSSLDPAVQAVNMNRIAFALYTRYQLQGDKMDCARAKTYFREALELCPPGHFNRIQILNNFGRMLGKLGDLHSDPSNVDLSIRYFYEALDLCYASARTIILANLAIVLIYRYRQLGDLSDVHVAFAVTKTSLELQSENHPVRGVAFLFQAKAVIAMFPLKPTLLDTEIALDILHGAQDALSTGHPLLIETYRELSHVYSLRYSITKSQADLEDSFKFITSAVRYSNGGSQTRFEAATLWVERAERFDHSSLLDAYKSAIHILDLHLVLKPSLDLRHNIIKTQALSICADATSCALRRHDVVGAVELFEHGRGLFWTFIARLRTPLDKLRASGPIGHDLATEFESLSRRLEMPMTLGDDGENGERFRRVQRDWNAVVDKIRAVDGFSTFLLPPSYEDLQVAAAEGPVIILNASRHSCDAVIVLAHAEPVHVAFEEGTYSDIVNMSSEFQSIQRILYQCSVEERKEQEKMLSILLRRLWDVVVGAVVRALDPLVPRNSRIWWCPTGPFTSLPIHAAHPYRKGERGLSDIYVSSYTPTLSALIRSRQKRDAPAGAPSFVSIGQPNSAGYNQLLSVRPELDLVRQCLPGTVQFTELVDDAATRDAALTALSTHTYAHLACHGQQALGRPFDSHFAMHDGRLTLLDIVHSDAGRTADFAFLSACKTATGDAEAPDEVIHLAAALQFAGVSNVVGTMWKVDDQVVVYTVEAFYRAMVREDGVFDLTRAARALRAATRTTRDRVPLDQRIVFIHIVRRRVNVFVKMDVYQGRLVAIDSRAPDFAFVD